MSLFKLLLNFPFSASNLDFLVLLTLPRLRVKLENHCLLVSGRSSHTHLLRRSWAVCSVMCDELPLVLNIRQDFFEDFVSLPSALQLNSLPIGDFRIVIFEDLIEAVAVEMQLKDVCKPALYLDLTLLGAVISCYFQNSYPQKKRK